MQRIELIAAYLVLFVLLILFAACTIGCQATEIYTDARVFQIGAGHEFYKSTAVTASDARQQDISPQTEVDVTPVVDWHPQGRRITWPDGKVLIVPHEDLNEALRTGGVTLNR